MPGLPRIGAPRHAQAAAAAAGAGLAQARLTQPRHAGRARPTAGRPQPRATPVLALHHAAKSFGAVHAVADGTIDLYAGEAHALVGENGAGKSTMVKILAGVYQPDSGELLIDGHAGHPAQPGRRPGRRASRSSTRSPRSSPT